MLTYLGDQKLKRDFLEQIGLHEQQDQLIKGVYGQMNGAFRGCAIGCALHSLNILQGKVGPARADHIDDHTRYEAELGLPTWFAHMEDQIFEQLPDDQARTWPRRLAEAIPVGAVVDDVVLARCLRWALADEKFGVRYATGDPVIHGHIDGVIAGFDAEIATGGQASSDQRGEAARAARDARDARAARAAWAARAARAAWDARAAEKANAFVPAFSEFVLDVVRALPMASVEKGSTP